MEEDRTGPALPRPVTELGSLRAEIGELTGYVRGLVERVEDIRSDISQLPCRGKASGCSKPPSGEMVPRTKTGSRYPAITRADVDAALAKAAEAAEECAERTVEERLEALEVARSAKQRDRQRWYLELARTIIPLIAGAGIVGAVKLECPAQSAQRQQRPAIVQPQQRDAASAARR